MLPHFFADASTIQAHMLYGAEGPIAVEAASLMEQTIGTRTAVVGYDLAPMTMSQPYPGSRWMIYQEKRFTQQAVYFTNAADLATFKALYQARVALIAVASNIVTYTYGLEIPPSELDAVVAWCNIWFGATGTPTARWFEYLVERPVTSVPRPYLSTPQPENISVELAIAVNAPDRSHALNRDTANWFVIAVADQGDFALMRATFPRYNLLRSAWRPVMVPYLPLGPDPVPPPPTNTQTVIRVV